MEKFKSRLGIPTCAVEGAAMHFMSMVMGEEVEFSIGTMANKGSKQNELVLKGLVRGKGLG